ncbi:MAG: hypothetical protein ACLFSG_09610 [Halothiobacillaceae bacterium]
MSNKKVMAHIEFMESDEHAVIVRRYPDGTVQQVVIPNAQRDILADWLLGDDGWIDDDPDGGERQPVVTAAKCHLDAMRAAPAYTKGLAGTRRAA